MIHLKREPSGGGEGDLKIEKREKGKGKKLDWGGQTLTSKSKKKKEAHDWGAKKKKVQPVSGKG